MSRKIRYGMVGGGRGAFIGSVHRIAAAMDQQMDLVCGAFSSDPERSKASGGDFFLPPERCYGTFQEMIKAEAALPKKQSVDFIAIVTPNYMHFPSAKMALENGLQVMSDKPAPWNPELKELTNVRASRTIERDEDCTVNAQGRLAECRTGHVTALTEIHDDSDGNCLPKDSPFWLRVGTLVFTAATATAAETQSQTSSLHKASAPDWLVCVALVSGAITFIIVATVLIVHGVRFSIHKGKFHLWFDTVTHKSEAPPTLPH
jgi:hypothetical protein